MTRKQAQRRVPLLLIHGEDEYSVKQRAASVFEKWATELPDAEEEVIDASVTNSSEALKVVGRLREALQTLPFFGSGKRIWLKNANFLGDERAVTGTAVTEALRGLAAELEQLEWVDIRLLISASKTNKQRTFYRTIERIGEVEEHESWQLDRQGGTERAERWIEARFEELGVESTPEARVRLITSVGANPRQLSHEVEKAALYAEGQRVTEAHVAEVVSRNDQAEAFALADALGNRDLSGLLRHLKDELAQLKVDRQKSEIGLLYGLITKVRVMLLLKGLMQEGLLRPGGSYSAFKGQLSRLPDDRLPQDKRFNPKAMSPYLIYKALPQVQNYRQEELRDAMEKLLACNLRLISSGLDQALVLQQALVQIVKGDGGE